ncbi:hypothetical protein CPC08DRAFT_650721 [Agrocybe pediades]|nr:hypothetical protein CPC08DRAFT_650721 [Agrocybe pediades]
MLILASILLSRSNYTDGLSSFAPAALLALRDPGDADPNPPCPRQRIQILWTCVATILAASWVSVHPNIPNAQESKTMKTLRRIELMIWAIITPELVIYWAMRQWHGARFMETDFALQWTRTHGFFLQMGGFMLREEGKKDKVLGWKTLKKYYKQGRIDLSDVTEDRINDHSKADWFAKGLAFLQIFWFITQCIARFFEKNLILTELELATAALALLSLVMYFLWWNKPFNAGVPITITLLPAETDSHSNNDANSRLGSVADSSEHPRVPPVSQSADRPPQVPTIEKDKSSNGFQMWFLFQRIGEILSSATADGTDLLNGPARSAVASVPTFYSIRLNSDAAYLQMLLASISAAALFGSIHCIGWSRKIVFASYAASLAWRIASIVITASPLLWGLAIIFGYARGAKGYEDRRKSEDAFSYFRATSLYVSMATIPVYIVARLVLLVLALVELRDVPPGALASMQWTNVLPFIH